MQRAMTRARGSYPMMGRMILAVVLAGVFAGAAVPARADDRDRYDRGDRDRDRDRDRDAREWRAHHRRPVYHEPPPAYVYAPPPVVYAPPPPSAGINLIFPLHIR